MDAFERVLGSIDGGKVLDVATQHGGFVQILIRYLRSFSEIVGIDLDRHAIEVARDTVTQPRVRFQAIDAEHLVFPDRSFDTLTVSASLHHLSNIPRVLKEGHRVLKPGGHLILAEMHRDGQTEAELTSVYLHHWVARVDSALGQVHNNTLARQEVIEHIERLKFRNVTCYDDVDRDSDPMETTRIGHLTDLIDRTLHRAQETDCYRQLAEQGKALRERLYETGAQREPILILTGIK